MSINHGSPYILPLGVVLSQLPPSPVKDVLFQYDIPPTSITVGPDKVFLHFSFNALGFTAIWEPKTGALSYLWRQKRIQKGRPISGDRWLMEIVANLRSRRVPQRTRKAKESFLKLHRHYPDLPIWEGCDLLPRNENDDSEPLSSDTPF